jgi:CubicO group peptidase (beta-lactamase class C family)
MDTAQLKARVDGILSHRPSIGLAVGIVGPDGIRSFHAHGSADIRSRTPITRDTVFRIASITKTFTAIAVMQLWEQGLVDLDAPANDYLQSYQLQPAQEQWRPATVRHLLTHTAGIPEVAHPSGVMRPEFGESVRAGRPLPSLAEYYRGGLRLDAEPGTRFVYGNHGFATLGQLVEDVSGKSLDRYLSDHVFEPLGMTASDLLRSARVRERLATGYTIRSGGPRVVTERDMITAGAASIFSTPGDMARYLAALVGGGTNEHGTMLKPATLEAMFQAQYRPDPRIPGVGLSFFRADIGGHHAVEHQGIHPGFDSQIFVAPDDDVAVMAFSNGTRLGMLWMPDECSRLMGALIDAPEPEIQRDIPHRPDIWADLCGRYALDAAVMDVRLRSMVGAGVHVFVRQGQLTLRCLTPVPALYRGLPLHPDDPRDPHVYRVDLSDFGLTSLRVVFGGYAGRRAESLHLDVMPITFRRRTR